MRESGEQGQGDPLRVSENILLKFKEKSAQTNVGKQLCRCLFADACYVLRL